MFRLTVASSILLVSIACCMSLAQTHPTAQPAKLISVSGALTAPATIHVNALNLPLPHGSPLTARYEWEFGDPSARYNRLVGWNAAHTYDRAGRYTIRLKLVSENGIEQTFSQTIDIEPFRGKTFYAAANGDDFADGVSPSRPVRSFLRAVRLARHGDRILLRGGDQFDIAATVELQHRDLVIGMYSPRLGVPAVVSATPEFATIRYVGPRNGRAMIEAHPRSVDLHIENVAFDTIYSRDTEKKSIPSAIRPGGINFTARRCAFLNVGDGVNSNARPSGVMMQDCSAPLVTGVRGYLAWIEGQDHAYLGNTAVNSTREAVMRISFTGAQRVLIAHNLLTNIDRENVDRTDTAKNALTVHSGRHIYIARNTFATGPFIVGPLGDGDGFRQPNQKLESIVIEDNLIRSSFLKISHGTAGAMVRNNRFWSNDRAAIQVEGYSDEYKRGSTDISIIHNTVLNNGSRGSFLRVSGRVEGVRVRNNLFAAPKLAPGSHSSAVVFVNQKELSDFTAVAGNIWPVCRPQEYAAGGVFYVWPVWSDPRGYIKLDRWNQQTRADDAQSDITLDASLRPKMMDDALKRPRVAGAGYDVTGKPRGAKTAAGAHD